MEWSGLRTNSLLASANFKQVSRAGGLPTSLLLPSTVVAVALVDVANVVVIVVAVVVRRVINSTSLVLVISVGT